MLNDAKQRNDVLSQAYAALHAEYVALKTSQVTDQSYQPQFNAAYSGAPPMGLNQGVNGLEMDSIFVYGDMSTAGYAL